MEEEIVNILIFALCFVGIFMVFLWFLAYDFED